MGQTGQHGGEVGRVALVAAIEWLRVTHAGTLSGERIEMILAALARLTDELAAARQVLVFADGLAVGNTGFALSDLYASDYAVAQDALAAAGCWKRGGVEEACSPEEDNRG